MKESKLASIGTTAALLAVAAAVACGDAEPAATTHRAAVTDATSATPEAVCSEAEALSMLRLEHLRALHLAFAMRDRLQDPELQASADRMVEEHMNVVHAIDEAMSSANLRRANGAALDALGELTERAVREVASAQPAQVERLYVHHQVAEHMHAIGLVDNVIAPSVRDERLSEVVQRGRALFARHARRLFEREVALEGLCGRGGQPDAPAR